MKPLVIGRFQPVHLGHVEVLKDLRSRGLDDIVLGIGTAGKERTSRNPFTYDEIRKMWLPVMDELEVAYNIYEIPDINDPPNYAKHVETITGCKEEDTLIVSRNSYTLDCFTNYGKSYQTLSVDPKLPLPSGKGYLCATLIREWIQNEGPWQQYVPASTKQVIEEVGIDMLKKISQQ